MAPLTISTLAKHAGVRSDTIRYYERAGLLPPPARSASGYRQYDPATIERLHLIRGAQRLGLRLREIADLLAVRDRGACPCGHAEALVRQRITELDAEIARLVTIRGQLTRLAAQCAAAACPDLAWPCEAEFIGAATNKKEVTTP